MALLTRSIRIVSEGDAARPAFPPARTATFGGHTIVRQGFKAFQVQGVEFYQLGQGGRLGHYPVHFHHARRTPPGTFVKDCSIHDSMTRWIMLHGTQDVHPRPQRRLQVHRPRLLPRGRHRDQQPAHRQHRHPGPRRGASNVPARIPARCRASWPPRSARTSRGRRCPTAPTTTTPPCSGSSTAGTTSSTTWPPGPARCGVCYWLLPARQQRDVRGPQVGVVRLHAGHLPRPGGHDAAQVVHRQLLHHGHDVLQHRGRHRGVPRGGRRRRRLPVPAPIENPLVPPAFLIVDGREVPNPKAAGYFPKIDRGGGRFATKCDRRRLRGDQRPQALLEQSHGHGHQRAGLHGDHPRPLHLVLPLGGVQLRSHLAATPVVPGDGQRPDRRAAGRPELRHRRRLQRLGPDQRPLGPGAQERVRGADAAGQPLRAERGAVQSRLPPDVRREPEPGQRHRGRSRRLLSGRRPGRHVPGQQFRHEPASVQRLRRAGLPGLQRVPGHQGARPRRLQAVRGRAPTGSAAAMPSARSTASR